MLKDTVRINFDFPRKKYPYLKMICAVRRQSIKEFATQLLINALEDAENELSTLKAQERLEQISKDDLVSWEEARKLAGWDDEI